MDITETLAPKSEQLDAIDLMGKPPRIFTVTKVDVKTTAEQPVSVHLAEFPRVWRPNVSMRRVLAKCWGSDSSKWIGHQVELYCEDGVKFGNDVTGGTRISRLSHIDGPKTVPLLLSQGRSGSWKVTPLPAVPTDDTPSSPPASETDVRIAALTTEWHTAEPERQAAIVAEVEALRNPTIDPGDVQTPDPSEPDATPGGAK